MIEKIKPHEDITEVYEELQYFVDRRRWQFAKTMPKNPHYYTIKDWDTNQHDFERFVYALRKYGELRWFFSRQIIYLDLDGWTYWTMDKLDSPVKDANLINRCETVLSRKTNRPVYGELNDN